MTQETKEIDISASNVLDAPEVMPEVNENAIRAVQEKQAQENSEAKAQGFDPEIHQSKDGKPVLTASGAFAKKRGAKKGSVKSQLKKPNEKTSETSAPETQQVSSAAAALVVSNIFERLQMVLISDEFEYTQKEKIDNCLAWEKTFDHYGGVNLSPPQALIVDHLAIIAARAAQPKTQSKLVLGVAWFKNKWSNFRSRKNALPDSRKNDERENDIRKEEKQSGAKKRDSVNNS